MKPTKVVVFNTPESVHWVHKFLFARERMNEYKAVMEEAKEVWLDMAGDDWDVVEVDGRPVFENIKTSPNRFSVADLKAKYPDIYKELTRKVPQSSVKVIE